MDKRREEASGGVSGWVSDRAGEWELNGPDETLMEIQKYFWNPMCDYWFRMEMEGWENIPEPPVLLVGIHSGAPFVWDAWTVGIQWWRHFGNERPIHGTAHDALMAAPGIGAYFRRMGVLPAAPDSMASALAAGHDVALWPGGEIDSLRHWFRRDEAILAGRKGFVKLAIRSGVPIVPISTVGGADGMPVIATGRRLAKLLQLDKARLKRFPISISLPWGISPAVLPEIPFPTKIRTAFQPPCSSSRIPSGLRTRTTSIASTRKCARASRAAWTSSRGGGASPSSAEHACAAVADPPAPGHGAASPHLGGSGLSRMSRRVRAPASVGPNSPSAKGAAAMTFLDPVPEVDFFSARARILAHGDATDGRFGLVEMTGVGANSMPPLHVHHNEDEGFYVLSGEVTFFTPGNEITLRPGEYFLAPKDVPHTYRVGDQDANWLVVSLPAGFEQFVLDVAALDDPDDPAALGALAAKHNSEILGPPGAMP